MGSCLPENESHPAAEARNITDKLMASFGSMLLYWYHYAINGKRIEVETDDDSIGGTFPAPAAWREATRSWVRAMHTSLNLYAEHEFNASTFAARVIAGTNSDMYSAITGAIGALRGPKHGGANEEAFRIQSRYSTSGRSRSGYHASASAARRSLSVSDTLSTPSAIRAMKSSSPSPGNSRKRTAT